MTGFFDCDTLPPLRDVIAAHDLRADKKLGQNFILDQNITDKIAATAGDLSDHVVFEIGPGPGGLTRSLLKTEAKQVIAIERDPRAISALKDLEKAAEGRLTIIEGDALETDLLSLASTGSRSIVANLPYNIATPLLIGWLKQIRTHDNAFSSMTLMFQREVAGRLTAEKSSKAYGRLSVMAQWLCDVRRCFDLQPAAFVPAPKVTSSIVQLTPRDLQAGAPSFDNMEALVAAAFNQRRKMIRSSLKSYKDILDETALDQKLRAEQLSIKDYITLAQALS